MIPTPAPIPSGSVPRWRLGLVLLAVVLLFRFWPSPRAVAPPQSADGPPSPAKSGGTNEPPIIGVALARATGLRKTNGASARTVADPVAIAVAQRLSGALTGLGQGTPPALVPVAGASPVDPRLWPRPVVFSPAQQNTLAQLRWRSGKQLSVRGDPDNQTIRFLKGLSLEPAAVAEPGKSGEETTALKFLSRNRELLRLQNPERELQRTDERRDELGFTQVKYAQRYAGLTVWPASLTVQLDPAGNAHLLTGAYVPTPEGLAVIPTVDSIRAAQIALESVGMDPQTPRVTPELMLYAQNDRTPRLAYRVETELGPLLHWVVLVDARSGQILDRINQVCTGASTGSGTDLGGKTRALNLWTAGNQHFLTDTSKPIFNAARSTPPGQGTTFGGIVILDANNIDPGVNPGQYAPALISSASTTAGFPAAGVSAAFNLSRVFDYFTSRHQRNSIDGSGGTIIGIINVPIDNAFWTKGTITFGSRDTWANSLDFAGHEMTHGVTEKTAGLVYRNQSGALNEAFSDVFGEAAEAFTTGQTDWVLGSQLARRLRSMKTPGAFEVVPGRPYPAKMSQFIAADDPVLQRFSNQDQGGVHFNSSIINHAFYQLAEGLPGALGMVAAERIFYRALTTKLQQQSEFIDCRVACVQAAEELFGPGSVPVSKTGEAFNAVEIFDQIAPPDPTPITSVAGQDSLLFTYVDAFSGFTFLARREAALGDPVNGTVLWSGPVAPNKRPALTGDGAAVMIVTADNDIAFVNTLTGVGQKLGYVGQVWSAGLSVDGQYAAIILRDGFGQPRNQINIINLKTLAVETYDLVAPTLDGGSIGTVLYGDTLDFSLDNGLLYYDALNRLRFGDGSVIDNWSIYAIDRARQSEFEVVRPLIGVNVGNPSVGQIHGDRLVFEAQNPVSASSTVYGMNLSSGRIGALYTINSSLGVAYPSLNGDDSVLHFSDYFFNGNRFLRSVNSVIGLTGDGLSFSGNASIAYDGNAAGPVIGAVYRRGLFSGVPFVQVTVSDPSAAEAGEDPAEFILVRSGGTSAALAVSLVLTGTAGNGADYERVPLSATIPAGSATTTVLIRPIRDAVVEGSETVTLTLSAAPHYALGGFVSASATIRADAAPTAAYTAWALANGVGIAEGNDDGDSYLNFMEFALGTRPKTVDAAGRISGEIQSVGNQSFLTLVVNRQARNPDVQYTVEISDNLVSWSSGAPHTAVVEDSATRLVVRDNSPAGTKTGRFMRLKVTAR